MEVSYRKNLGGSYMCVEEEGQLIEPYEVQMLEQYRIPCLLQVRTVISEGRRRYLYDISGKQQVMDYFSGKKIGYDMLRMFLFSIYEVCGRLSEYLLREEGLCLEMEYVYVNLEDGSLRFTYLPFYEKNLPAAFQMLMEQLLRSIDHQDKAAVELGYEVYQLCTGDNVNIGKLLETVLDKQIPEEEDTMPGEREIGGDAWEDETPDTAEIAKEHPKGNKQKAAGLFKKYMPGVYAGLEGIRETVMRGGKTFAEIYGKLASINGMPVQIHRKRRQKAGKRFPEVPEGAAMPEKEEEPLCPTEILGVRQDVPVGKLVYHGIHLCGDILIEGDSFLLGKNSEQVNGVIPAEGVSRLHARITRLEGDYFIEDLNSTNGTYVNDVMLEYHQPRQLKPKDRICFGVEEYVFL